MVVAAPVMGGSMAVPVSPMMGSMTVPQGAAARLPKAAFIQNHAYVQAVQAQVVMPTSARRRLSVLRAKLEAPKGFESKRNPLKNKAVMKKLNPLEKKATTKKDKKATKAASKAYNKALNKK